MYIVSGCSWSYGEFSLSTGGQPGNLIHGGLEWNFAQDGIKCVNLGIPGGSNLAVARRIEGWFERFSEKKVEEVIVFQTEWTRDAAMVYDEDYQGLISIAELQGIIISRFYGRLSDIAQNYNTRVNLIGGISDTIWLDKIENHYPGLRIICQSATNYLLNNQERIEDPIHSWYCSRTENLVKKLKSALPDSEIYKLINLIEKGFDRETLVYNNPEYFWPDGAHLNRKAYAKIYDFIKHKF
jgi:hypothetical protein